MPPRAGGPLSGLRVLDIATVFAGPFAAALMGDMGADVVKVELPGVGEVGHALAGRARESPWGAVAVGLALGYLLGGGLFTRPTSWLVRAALAALLVPDVRERAVRAWRGVGGAATSSPPTAAGAPV